MRRIVFVLFILSCVREVYTPPPYDYPEVMIQKLANGFQFNWNVIREKEGRITSLKAKGIYKGEGDYEIEGTIKLDKIEEPITNIDPYQEIKNLLGLKHFQLISHNHNEYRYSFPANLSLFNPGGEEGEGKLLISNGCIKEIRASSTGIEWEMEIEPLLEVPRKIFEIEGEIEPNILKNRLEYYGERRVEVKENRIYFEEIFPINLNGLLFTKGKYSILAIKPSPEGELLLAPDSIEHYKIVEEIQTRVKDIEIRENEYGGFWLLVNFNKALEEEFVGILINKELFGIGHPAGNALRFTVKNQQLAREIYAILKASTTLNPKGGSDDK